LSAKDGPKPVVTFDTFGENSLALRAFVGFIEYRLLTVTEPNGNAVGQLRSPTFA
jgi:hypothetical protein